MSDDVPYGSPVYLRQHLLIKMRFLAWQQGDINHFSEHRFLRSLFQFFHNIRLSMFQEKHKVLKNKDIKTAQGKQRESVVGALGALTGTDTVSSTYVVAHNHL